MRTVMAAGALLLGATVGGALRPGSTATGIDSGDQQLQAIVQAYVARTMALQPVREIRIEIGLPDASGLRRVMVRLGGAESAIKETFYITADGKEVLRGTLDKLSADPWYETRLKLQPVLSAAPSTGQADADVTIVEFGDFQCPYCQEMNERVEQLLNSFPGRLRWVFADLPLPVHKWSRDAAAAGDCVAAQGSSKFWLFEHSVYSHQTTIKLETARRQLRDLAVQAGVESSTYESCLASPETERRIAASTKLAQDLGVANTPTLFVNGRKLAGAVSFDALKAAVENELALSSSNPRLATTN